MNKKPTPAPRSARGFTLTELLIVVIVIAALLGFSFPVMKKFRQNANQSKCVDQLRNWTVVFASFSSDNNGMIQWRNWAPIGWETGSPYVPYWTGGGVDLSERQDSGAHGIHLQMRHCPAVPHSGTGNPSPTFRMIRPSMANGQVIAGERYSLSSITYPSRFMMMIETLPNSGGDIRDAGGFTSEVRPLTEPGANLRHNGPVNGITGDLSVRTMSWKEIQEGMSQWTKL